MVSLSISIRARTQPVTALSTHHLRMSEHKPYAKEARLRSLHNSAIALVANYCIRERGRINETNYTYSIIPPPPPHTCS